MGKSLKLSKMQFHGKKILIHLISRVFCLEFFKFSGPPLWKMWTYNCHVLVCIKHKFHQIFILPQSFSQEYQKKWHEVIREKIRTKICLYSHCRHVLFSKNMLSIFCFSYFSLSIPSSAVVRDYADNKLWCVEKSGSPLNSKVALLNMRYHA